MSGKPRIEFTGSLSVNDDNDSQDLSGESFDGFMSSDCESEAAVAYIEPPLIAKVEIIDLTGDSTSEDETQVKYVDFLGPERAQAMRDAMSACSGSCCSSPPPKRVTSPGPPNIKLEHRAAKRRGVIRLK